MQCLEVFWPKHLTGHHSSNNSFQWLPGRKDVSNITWTHFVVNGIKDPTKTRTWSFKTEDDNTDPVFLDFCGSQNNIMNARKFRQLLTHLDSPDVVNPPIWCPCRIKQLLQIICSSYTFFSFLREILLSLKMFLIGMFLPRRIPEGFRQSQGRKRHNPHNRHLDCPDEVNSTHPLVPVG